MWRNAIWLAIKSLDRKEALTSRKRKIKICSDSLSRRHVRSTWLWANDANHFLEVLLYCFFRKGGRSVFSRKAETKQLTGTLNRFTASNGIWQRACKTSTCTLNELRIPRISPFPPGLEGCHHFGERSTSKDSGCLLCLGAIHHKGER